MTAPRCPHARHVGSYCPLCGTTVTSEIAYQAERAEARATLTAADVTRTLADERHLGWGYAYLVADLSDADIATMNDLIADAANRLGLSYDDLFLWSNSKNARWLADELLGASLPRLMHGSDALSADAPAKVARYLNADTIATLRAEEA